MASGGPLAQLAGSGPDPGAGAAAPELTAPTPLSFEQAVERILGRLEDWVVTFVELLPNIVVAGALLLIFAVAAQIFARLARRAILRTSQNEQIASLLSVGTRLGILAVGIFVALGLLQLDKALASLLAGVGIVGLALGFAFQDIAANFMSGIIMALRQPFQLGDLVHTHDQLGTIERVTLRATVLRLFTGQLVIIPNKEVLQSPIINYTQSGERRVDIELGIAYDADLEKTRRTVVEALENLDYRDPEREVEFYYSGFGSSSIDFSARFWIDLESDQGSFLEARSRAIEAIKRALDDAGLSIPFPVRTLDLPDRLLESLGAADPAED